MLNVAISEEHFRRLVMICNSHLSENASRLESQGLSPAQIRSVQARDLDIKNNLREVLAKIPKE